MNSDTLADGIGTEIGTGGSGWLRIEEADASGVIKAAIAANVWEIEIWSRRRGTDSGFEFQRNE